MKSFKEAIENRIEKVKGFMENRTEAMERCERKGDIISVSTYMGFLDSSTEELVFLNSLLSEINK